MADEQQQLLRKTLAFIDVPGYDFAHFERLLRTYFPADQKRPLSGIVRKKFSTLRLLMAMVHRYAADADDLRPSVRLSESAVLLGWGWLVGTQDWRPTARREFVATLHLYYTHLCEYLVKLAPAFTAEHGLLGGGPGESVEYPLRSMEITGMLGLGVQLASLFGDEPGVQHMVHWLEKCVRNNPGCLRPSVDNHLIDIFLGMLALYQAGRGETAAWWLDQTLARLALRRRAGTPLPELYNRLDLVIEYAATGERPPMYVDDASTLIYFLFELCLWFDASETYRKYRSAFEGVDLQCWYPPGDVEPDLYRAEVHSGTVESSISLPEDFAKFRDDARARHERYDSADFESVRRGLAVMPLMASRHYRTPVFPIYWRSAMFPEPYGNRGPHPAREG